MFSYLKRIQFVVILLLSSALVISLWIGRTPSREKVENPDEKTVALVLNSGEKVFQSQIQAMITFLEREKGTLEGERMNPLNQGWFSQLFLESRHWKNVPSLNKMFEEAAMNKKDSDRLWYPYTHRVLSHINQKELWEYMAPSLPDVWQDYSVAMRRENEKLLQQKVRLYLTQMSLSMEMQERILRHYERSYLKEVGAGAFEDGGLTAERLSMLNNKNLSDWFGEKTIEHCARLLFVGADEAKRLGYSCSSAEARSLWQSDLESLLASDASAKDLDPAVVVPRLLQKMGLTQKELTEIYKTLVLFRSLLNHHNQFLLHDQTLSKDVAAWKAKRVQGVHFSIPPSYTFENARELLQWLAYTKRLCHMQEFNGVEYPVAWKELEDFGELSVNVFDLEFKVLKASDVLSAYSFDQWIQWQAKDGLWQEACAIIDPFEGKEQLGEKERKSLLLALPAPQRKKLEELSVRYIAENDPNKIATLLDEEQLQEKEAILSQHSSNTPFEGLADVKDLIKRLNAIASEQDNSSFYFQDASRFYQFVVHEKKPSRRMSFEEAKQEGVLDLILEKESGLLEDKEDLSREESVKREARFLTKASSLYPVENCFSSLIKIALDGGFEGDLPEKPSSKESLDFTASHYWVPYLEAVRSSENHAEMMISSELPWGLKTSELDISRSESSRMGVDLFKVSKGQFAPSFVLLPFEKDLSVKRISDKPYLIERFESSGDLYLVEDFVKGSEGSEVSGEGNALARNGQQYFSDLAAASLLEPLSLKARKEEGE